MARLLELTFDESHMSDAAMSLVSLGEVIPEEQREEVVTRFLNFTESQGTVTREEAKNLGLFFFLLYKISSTLGNIKKF